MKESSHTPQPPNEVIVVEGRDDTKRLIETFGTNVKTIETNGSAVSRKVVSQIQGLAEEFGVIVFTDPDFQGDRIRRIVTEAVPSAKQAHIRRDQAQSKRQKDSLGLEHAHPRDIIDALDKVMTPVENQALKPIPMSELIELGLVGNTKAKEKRQQVAEYFHLGHLNGKQLQHKLALYQISYTDLLNFLNKGGD